MGPQLGIDVAAPAEIAWDELVDLNCWPQWGPSVRAARLHDGARRLHADAKGSVQTVVGLWLPFEVTTWTENPDARSWAWRVRGVRATSHTVHRTGPRSCRVEMAVPVWAPGYLAVVAPALRRIRRRAEARAAGLA